ncbi:MAG: hypothetical protein JF887_03245 [Candidatus Dormibacteraeota bacterium]|uniref:Uncharacterized protein n=1 Tax=Candidatus Amunia macphersoniae TaxID=3127014 RepID=A0A934KL01_9BACT|nr:hypothetical protein [Candidatus Dormibacteraeota bacterium]
MTRAARWFFPATGEQVTGAVFGSGSTGVVLAHEYFANLCGWRTYAMHLRDLGMRALAFDFQSDPRYPATSLRRRRPGSASSGQAHRRRHWLARIFHE